jgi:neopullulanase
MKIIIKALLCLFITVPAVAQMKIYPTHWWTGMKTPTLQLMIHKKDIGNAKISLTPYAGVKLVKSNSPENKNYLFVDLSIASTTKPGKLNFTVKEGTASSGFTYTLKKKDAGDGKTRVKGVNASDLVYLIMPDRFANGDTSNDKVVSARDKQSDRSNPFLRHGGDIKGVEDKLDYLKELGITTVWMTPVIENDMPLQNEWGNKVAGYHGYWFTDHYTVDPRLGGDSAYKKLIETSHNKGMKIVQDAVYNHVGDQHWFILDPPTRDWINNWPSYQGANHKEEVFYDPYTTKMDKEIMVGGWFVPHLPDLNLKNPMLAKFLIQHAIWTTEEYGVDGWRVDTYKYCDEQFMNNVNAALEKEFPTITIFGEAWCSTPFASAYFVRNNVNFPFKHNLQGVTEFPIAYGIKDVAMGNANALYTLLAQDQLYKDPKKNCIFLENHDMNRILSELKDDVSRLKMATGMLLTIRGIPQLYYGTEVLMKNMKVPSDAEVRRDFAGGWAEDGLNKFKPEGRTAEEKEYFNFLRNLANYRLKSSAISKGKTLQYQPFDNVYVYFRFDDKQRVMCIVNPNDKEKELDMLRYTEGYAGKSEGRDVISGRNLQLDGKLTIPAKTFLLIEVQ